MTESEEMIERMTAMFAEQRAAIEEREAKQTEEDGVFRIAADIYVEWIRTTDEASRLSVPCWEIAARKAIAQAETFNDAWSKRDKKR